MDRELEMAAFILECRATCRRLLGDRYEAAVAPWRKVLGAAGDRALTAAIAGAKRAQADGDANGVALILAAAADVIDARPQK